MRESRTYGSVRGALSNERPYRDRGACHRAAIRPTRWLCAEHDRQRGGESPLSSLMVAKD